ncbi:hypothetical protein MASR1M66_15080 [Aminivibrio sp.]
MAAGKKKKILSLLILLPLVVIGFLSFFLLSGKDVAVSTYKQTLQNMISDTPGWSFDAGPISGNPVTGYVAEDVRIFYLEREIARAKSLAVRLSLLSLARGNPEASRVTLREVFLPAEEFFAALRETVFRVGQRTSNISPWWSSHRPSCRRRGGISSLKISASPPERGASPSREGGSCSISPLRWGAPSWRRTDFPSAPT